MSSLTPRTAFAIAVVLPVTILTMSRLVPMAIVPIAPERSGSVQRRAVVESKCPIDNQNSLQLDIQSTSTDRVIISRQTAAVTSPVRRGPQIVGEHSHGKSVSLVFASFEDPFTDGSVEFDPSQPITALPLVPHQLDRPGASEPPASVTAAACIRASDGIRMFDTKSIDSVIHLPCQRRNPKAHIRSPCRIEIDLFGELSDRIFPCFRE
jgi:hypothetical protein